jgi:transposase
VIGPTGAVHVMVATKPVDFRKGAEGLAALVRETMGADPFSLSVYVFRAKRADRITGVRLCWPAITILLALTRQAAIWYFIVKRAFDSEQG